MLLVLAAATPAAAEPTEFTYQQLSKDMRRHVEQVRASCRELDPAFKPWNPMQGVTTIDLDGDGDTDVLVDNRHLCNDHMPGANCSNRGCDLLVWKQAERRGWKKVFEEHLHRSFLSIDAATRKLQLMAVSIYAGDPRCEPAPGTDYTSGQSCDLIARFRNGAWQWERIR